jgi:hypothetical protein
MDDRLAVDGAAGLGERSRSLLISIAAQSWALLWRRAAPWVTSMWPGFGALDRAIQKMQSA